LFEEFERKIERKVWWIFLDLKIVSVHLKNS
jgi:hypothetical protein